jgi:outer membrane lipopolysaccharide assembly protein LptE/RlpB
MIKTSLTKHSHYQNSSNKYSEFYKRTLREKMLKLSKGSTADKLQSLKIAEELADKSTLPILRKGLKDMNLKIVERSAELIRKFK